MLKRFKLRSLLIGLALLALVGLLSNTTGQEAVLAEGTSAQAQVTVTLEISNTSMPIGGTTYEIQMIIFTKNFVPIATQIIIPSASIPPQETRTFGPFTLSETPNDLTLRGRKTFPYPPFEEPFSVTIFPLYSDIPYQVDSLIITAHITAVVPPPPPVPPVDIARIQADLNKGPGYFAIAERANQALSPEEKEKLREAITPILARGQALLGGPKAPPTVMAYIPPELDVSLRAIASEVNAAVAGILGPKATELELLRPVTEVVLAPPHTHWTCYWSYAYAWWTYYFAYWNYVIHDTWLGYMTFTYAYYSYVYAYYCYLVC
ncbi:MAG: hypothetical protein ACUVUT_02695 [Candidatus Bipolaricaulia bacterium]